MSVRQLPLFPGQPGSPEDLNRYTPVQVTLPLFQEYLKKEGKSEHTIKAFTGDVLLMLERIPPETPIGQVTTTGLNDFLKWMESGRGIPCSRKTYARRVTTLKVMFKWLHQLGAIPHDPAKAVLQRSGPAPLSQVLDNDQIKAAIDFAQGMKRGEDTDYRPELLFRLLLDTGIKKSETTRLLPDDLDRSNPRMPALTIKHNVRNMYKERRIGVEPEWVKLLDLYMQQYTPKDTIFNCTARNLEYILTDIGEGADIPFKLSFEVMRWTCAVRDYRNAMDEDYIREKLGLSKTSWYETSNKIHRLSEQLTEHAEQN